MIKEVMLFKVIFFFKSIALAALLLGGAEPFMGIMSEKHFCNIIVHLDQWFRCHL